MANLGIYFGLITTFSYGVNTLLIQKGTRDMDASLGLWINTATSLVGLGLLTAFFLGQTWNTAHWNLPAMVSFLIAGFFTSWLGRRWMFQAIVRIGPAQAGTFQIANPLLTLVVAALLLHEMLSLHALLGLILSVLGLLFIAWDPATWRRRPAVTSGRTPVASGYIIAFISSVAYAIGAVFRKHGMMLWDQAALGALLGTFIGFVMMLPKTRAVWNFYRNPKLPKRGMAWFAFSGLATTVAQVALMASMRYLPTSIATLFVSLQPLVILPLSRFVFKSNEHLDARITAGCLAVVAGMVAITM